MEELILKQKHEDMMRYGYICLRQFPKSEKHTLSAEIRQSMYEIDKHIIRATKRFKRLSHDYEHGLVDLAHVNSSVMSWFGHCGHAHVLNGKIKCLEALVLRRPTEQTI